MSDKHNEQSDEAMRRGKETVPVKSAQALARRRWLRSGLKATPVVVASLAARPALAWHCIAPSAWGSINPGNGDVNFATLSGSLTRFHPVDFGVVFQFSDFATASGSGWTYLKGTNGTNNRFSKFPNNLPAGKKKEYLQGTYSNSTIYPPIAALTVDGLCAGLGITTPSGSGSSAPLAMIATGRNGGVGQVPFGASMLIALINLKFKNSTLPGSCYIAGGVNVIEAMASGSYTPSGQTQPWTKGDIADYLHYNWFARR